MVDISLVDLAYIGVGAFAGGIGRFILSKLFNGLKEEFPWGTFGANLLGSFLIGLVAGWGLNHYLPHGYHLFMATGFCGALTTFSTFSLENIRLYHRERLKIFGAYIFVSALLCLMAVVLGLYLGGLI